MHNSKKRVPAHKRRTYATGLAMACGVVLTASALPAWSQQGDTQRDGTLLLEPITVEGNSLYGMAPTEETGGYAARAATVGTKTPATLRAIPQSVSVVTRDVIEDRNYTTLDELARTTPGLRVLSNSNGRSSIYSRGYEYSSYKINGLPSPMASILGTLPNLAAFDRVEVLRGPSGLFNGGSTMGGIVNLVLKKPTQTFQGHVTGRYGSWNRYYGALDLSGPLLANGRVRGRLVAAKKGSDGFPDGNEVGSDTLYGTLAFDLTDDTLLSVGMLYQGRDIVPNAGVPTSANGDLLDYSHDTFFGADWNSFQMDSYDFIAELTHDFDNGGHGRIAARYSDRQGSFNYIYAGSALTNDKTSVAGVGRRYDQTALSLDASYSQTFETFGNASEFVVGVDYKQYETDAYGGRYRDGGQFTAEEFRAYPYVDIVDTGSLDEHSETEAYGLYTKVTFRPLSSLALIGGARLSGYDIKHADHITGITRSQDDSVRVDPYAGVVYDVNLHHSLYASYSTVFTPQTAVDASGHLLDPREGEQYEVGIKGSYFAGALNARLSLFRLDDENAAATVPGESYVAPIEARTVKGVEFEITGSPTPNWDLTFGYTYLDTDTELGTTRQDGIFLLMPRHRANLWAQYHFTSGTFEGLRLGAGVTAVGDFESSRGIKAPGYVVANTMIGYDFTDKFSAQLNVNNIFDNEYYTRVGSMGVFNMRGEPVNAMLSVRYDF